MTGEHTGRYSKYIRPFSILLDLAVINILPFCFFDGLNLEFNYFIPYQIFVWISVAFLIKFYAVYRFTTPIEILSKLVRQSVLFLLLVIAFFPFSKETIFSGRAIALYMCSAMALITIFKWLLFYYLNVK